MKLLSKTSLSQPISLLVVLSLIFPLGAYSQVSKPKKPKKVVEEVSESNVAYTEEIAKIVHKLPSQPTLGQLFEHLDDGIDHKGKEQILKSFKGAKNWRDSKLPELTITPNTVTAVFSEGKKSHKITLAFEFRNEVFATINDRPIYITEVDNPKLLMSRVNDIIKKELGKDKKQASFLMNLLLPKAHAFSFGLSIGGGFISQIFSMIMMYKMMKMFTKAFRNQPTPHHHHYYPPSYQQPYYPPSNPYNQYPANPYYGAPYGGTR